MSDQQEYWSLSYKKIKYKNLFIYSNSKHIEVTLIIKNKKCFKVRKIKVFNRVLKKLTQFILC